MFRTLPLCAVFTFALFAAAEARANPTWTDPYPKTGTVNGSILIRASINLAAGTSTTGAAKAEATPVGGGVPHVYNFVVQQKDGPATVDTGEKVFMGLTSGQNYSVIVKFQVISGGTTSWAQTDAKTATAK